MAWLAVSTPSAMVPRCKVAHILSMVSTMAASCLDKDQITYKGTVNFDDINREVFQIGQG